jgi:HD-like signal output (HDOD) protein
MQSVHVEAIELVAAERRIERIHALPVSPTAVRQLLDVHHDSRRSHAGCQLLLDSNPQLQRQLATCVRLLGGTVCRDASSIRMADIQGLELDEVSEIMLALAAARPFSYVCTGPLGAHAFWHHALCNAALCFRLASEVEASPSPHAGTAFLAGLLHNIGFMVIGYVFPPEFRLLNRLCACHPDIPVTILERCVLGLGEAQDMLDMGHARIGAWLMREWDMPPEIETVTREHHNAGYTGEAAAYCQLVMAVNSLLNSCGIGDDSASERDTEALSRIGVDESVALDALEELFVSPEILNNAVRALISHQAG